MAFRFEPGVPLQVFLRPAGQSAGLSFFVSAHSLQRQPVADKPHRRGARKEPPRRDRRPHAARRRASRFAAKGRMVLARFLERRPSVPARLSKLPGPIISGLIQSRPSSRRVSRSLRACAEQPAAAARRHPPRRVRSTCSWLSGPAPGGLLRSTCKETVRGSDMESRAPAPTTAHDPPACPASIRPARHRRGPAGACR